MNWIIVFCILLLTKNVRSTTIFIVHHGISPRIKQRIITHLRSINSKIVCQELSPLHLLTFKSAFAPFAQDDIENMSIIIELKPTQPAASDNLTRTASTELITALMHGNLKQLKVKHVTITGSLVNYGIYEFLERLGFLFYHPFSSHPVTPTLGQLQQRIFRLNEDIKQMADNSHWKIQRWHVHTQHPLELTEFLNGLIPITDDVISAHVHRFEGMLEWLLAHKQESIEWIPLRSQRVPLHIRTERWMKIAGLCKEYGVKCGVDVPMSLSQQHSWTLTSSILQNSQAVSALSEFNSDNDRKRNIENNIKFFLDELKFDFMSTEIGNTEFTHGSCDDALAELDHAADYLHKLKCIHPNSNDCQSHLSKLPVKIHISAGQKCTITTNASNITNVNFNFMPSLGSENLILMPHTVQLPSLNGDFAGVYGNSNFSFMRQFIQSQLSSNKTEQQQIIWYPETAYWVNYDIDVPLFLPVFMLMRIRDVKILRELERNSGRSLEGQMVFESGWEWGYWLNNMITARLSWIPPARILAYNEWEILSDLLHPLFTSLFSDNVKVEMDIRAALMHLIRVQEKYLIGDDNLMGYLVGKDTWSDITATVSSELATTPQPHVSLRKAKLSRFIPMLSIEKLKTDLDGLRRFADELEVVILKLSGLKYAFINDGIGSHRRQVYFELLESTQMLYYRALFVFHLYKYAISNTHSSIQMADLILKQAYRISEKRSRNFKVPMEYISAWHNENPTCYRYMYLWTTKSLHYWKRDLEIVKASWVSWRGWSPCFMNIIDPVDVVFGYGRVADWKKCIGGWLEYFGLDRILVGKWGACLAVPEEEPLHWF